MTAAQTVTDVLVQLAAKVIAQLLDWWWLTLPVLAFLALAFVYRLLKDTRPR